MKTVTLNIDNFIQPLDSERSRVPHLPVHYASVDTRRQPFIQPVDALTFPVGYPRDHSLSIFKTLCNRWSHCRIGRQILLIQNRRDWLAGAVWNEQRIPQQSFRSSKSCSRTNRERAVISALSLLTIVLFKTNSKEESKVHPELFPAGCPVRDLIETENIWMRKWVERLLWNLRIAVRIENTFPLNDVLWVNTVDKPRLTGACKVNNFCRVSADKTSDLFTKINNSINLKNLCKLNQNKWFGLDFRSKLSQRKDSKWMLERFTRVRARSWRDPYRISSPMGRQSCRIVSNSQTSHLTLIKRL
jgi:hypothetical protein